MITFSDNIARKPYLGSTEIAEVWLGNVLIYPENTVDYSRQYLTFDILQSGNIGYKMSTNTLQYSKNGGATWTNGSPNTNIPVNAGDKVLVKFTNPVLYKEYNTSSTQTNGVCKFYTDCSFNVYGNIMSLIYGDDFNDNQKMSTLPVMKDNYGNTVNVNHFINLFYNCNKLISAKNLVLPATILKDECYNGMFQSCTSLTTAPSVLPASYVTAFSYSHMFQSCTSLVSAPALPATTVGRGGYSHMFQSCSKLVNAPELPATSLGIDCYKEMFSRCTSLVNAPALPATTLAIGCYDSMFQNCSKLNYIKAMFTTTPSNTYTSNWVENVASSGTFVKNSAATWNVTGVNGVPTGWTVQRDHPKIYKKYRATYSNGTTVDGDCDGNNLVINEVTKSGLKTIVIGECVPAIVLECFADCADLTSVIIEGNTSIDHYSFARNNKHLTSITMYSTTPPPCQSTAFTYYNGSSYVPMTSIKIYVPSQSVNAYKTASGWSRYSTKIQAIP